MSAHVTNILAGIKTTLASVASEYTELQYVQEVQKNTVRAGGSGFGVRPLEAQTGEGVNKAYTLDHRFELILTKSGARWNDSEIEDCLETLYDDADDFFKALVHTKIGLPLLVINIFSPSIPAPEILVKEKLVVIRLQFLVKYRSNLT